MIHVFDVGTGKELRGVADVLLNEIVNQLSNSQIQVISPAQSKAVRGGDAAENAVHLEGILSGEIKGAKRDLTLVNAAGGFVVAGLARDMSDGIALAREQIDSGRALEKLRGFQQFRATRPA